MIGLFRTKIIDYLYSLFNRLSGNNLCLINLPICYTQYYNSNINEISLNICDDIKSQVYNRLKNDGQLYEKAHRLGKIKVTFLKSPPIVGHVDVYHNFLYQNGVLYSLEHDKKVIDRFIKINNILNESNSNGK